MDWNSTRELRLAVITALVSGSTTGYIGRTALMKFCYFLQVLNGLPLGYNFTLYSYGPFDSDVLSDLNSAESAGAVKSQVVFYPGGYGYEIREGAVADQVMGNRVLSGCKDKIDSVLEKFGGFGSADLELLSTIIYVNREAGQKKAKLSPSELAQRVRDVKPRFMESYIREKVDWLMQEGFLSQ